MTLEEALGAELSATLLGVPVSSLHCDPPGEDLMRPEVVARQQFLTGLVEDLAGAYTPAGIRRWLLRGRVELEGWAPLDVLAGESDAHGEQADRVRRLAAALRGAGPAARGAAPVP